MQTYSPPAPPPHTAACPHLGLRGDDATHCAFATQAHRCYQDRRARIVPLDHQAALCLTARHSQCPMFGGAPSTFPVSGRPQRAGLLTRIVAAVAFTLAAAAGASVWFLSGSDGRTPAAPAAVTAPASGQASPGPPAATVTQAAMTSSPAAATPAALASRPPARYRVRPGDNLTSIAAFFGARMEDMIRLNGLPPDGSIQVDQELQIPQTP